MVKILDDPVESALKKTLYPVSAVAGVKLTVTSVGPDCAILPAYVVPLIILLNELPFVVTRILPPSFIIVDVVFTVVAVAVPELRSP